jgi:hypothetical protein
MGATLHRRRASPVLLGTPNRTGKAPPKPEGSSENSYQDQQAEQAHNALFLSERQVIESSLLESLAV